MIKVLIVDQFSNITPYSLQQNPVRFDDLIEQEINKPISTPFALCRKAELREVAEDFKPEMCTTVIRANERGMAEAWRYRWDTSG